MEQLADLIDYYPSVYSPNFQTLLSAKKEFSELPSRINERLPPIGLQYFNHQKFTHRFLRVYDDLLVLSETGSGKTGEILGFLERARQASLGKIQDKYLSHFERAIIITNKAQLTEIKTQLINKFSNGTLETEAVKRATTPEERYRAYNAELKKFYVFKTPGVFTARLKEKYQFTKYEGEGPDKRDTLATFAADYSDSIIWIDEAHNIVPESVKDATGKQGEYNILHKIFHNMLRGKRVLTTATPMINSVREIGVLANLVIPNDGKIPDDFDYQNINQKDFEHFFPGLIYGGEYSEDELNRNFKAQFPVNFNYETAGLEQYEPYFRGRVSFVRAPDTGAIVSERGQPLDITYQKPNTSTTETFRLNLYLSYMSDFQDAAYQEAKKIRTGVEISARNAANFVFPDGKWGIGISSTDQTIHSAFGKEVETASASESYRRYVNVNKYEYSATPELALAISSLDNIRKLSAKYATIIEIINRDQTENKFVYSSYVNGSGAIVFALCLEAMGFVKYSETKSIFKTKQIIPGQDREVKSGFENRVRRYALYTGETPDAIRQSILETMNSPENRNGKYIEVFIATGIGKEGINVNNVLQIHLIDAEWHQSGIYQAISRGIRATSHENILHDLRKEVRNQITTTTIAYNNQESPYDKTPEENKKELDKRLAEIGSPDDVKIQIKIYKHAAIPSSGIGDSIDVRMYATAQSKDFKIKRVMRILKQCAIGCQIHRDRNIRSHDVDLSSTCDYDDCNYQCVDPTPVNVDLDSYLDFTQDDVNKLKSVVINLFRYYQSIDLNLFKELIPDFNLEYLIMTLSQLSEERYQFYDRFGNTSYLREDNGIWYISSDYPSVIQAPNHLNSYYNSNLITIIRSQIKSGGLSQGDLAIRDQLESAILNKINNFDDPVSSEILRKYQAFWFETEYPSTEINEYIKGKKSLVRKAGRQRKESKHAKIEKMTTEEMSNFKLGGTPLRKMYVHNVSILGMNIKNTALTASLYRGEGEKRILLIDEAIGWRDPTEDERVVIDRLIQVEIDKRLQNFRDKFPEYHGLQTETGFKLVDVGHESTKASESSRDVNRGRECTTVDPLYIIDALWVFTGELPAEYTNDETSKADKIKFIKSKDYSKKFGGSIDGWADTRIEFEYFYLKNKPRTELCKMLYDVMKAKGAIYEFVPIK